MEGLGVVNNAAAPSGSPLHTLHVGCGNDPLPECFKGMETRLDIDPRHSPDVVASMTDMGNIGPFDAVFSQHCLEHIYPHEVPVALGEFFRVLVPGGTAVVLVPDLEDVKPDETVLYSTAYGPVCGLDLYYGASLLIQDNPHMAHHSGFTRATLQSAMKAAGFEPVEVRRLTNYNLIGVGVKP